MAAQLTNTSSLPRTIKWLGKRATLLVQYMGPGFYVAEYCYRKHISKNGGYHTDLVTCRIAVTREKAEEKLMDWVRENGLLPVDKVGDKSVN